MTPSAKVVYFSIPDTGYPRNARIRAYLHDRLGADVVIPDVGVDITGAMGKIRRLASLVTGSRNASAIFLAEFGTNYALPAWVIARLRRSTLVVDGFVGHYETAVEDWGLHRPRSARASLFRLIDWLAVRCADIYLIDTEVRADEIRRRYRTGSKVLALPVGAPSWAVAAQGQRSDEDDDLRILYYGNYIPLHGLDHVVEALADPRLSGRIRATLIGDGGLRNAIEADVQARGLDDVVTFLPPVTEDRLLGFITSHDVVLGIFGTSVKAQGVIANKVWQGLAGGKTVITRSSPALTEVASIVGSQLRQVTGMSSSIADELVGLADGELAEHPETADRLESFVASAYERLGDRLSTSRPV